MALGRTVVEYARGRRIRGVFALARRACAASSPSRSGNVNAGHASRGSRLLQLDSGASRRGLRPSVSRHAPCGDAPRAAGHLGETQLCRALGAAATTSESSLWTANVVADTVARRRNVHDNKTPPPRHIGEEPRDAAQGGSGSRGPSCPCPGSAGRPSARPAARRRRRGRRSRRSWRRRRTVRARSRGDGHFWTSRRNRTAARVLNAFGAVLGSSARAALVGRRPRRM